MHNQSASEVFRDSDLQTLRSICLYCREATVGELRKLLEYIVEDYAREVANAVVVIRNKKSLRGIPPDVRQWATKLMRETGVY